MNKPEALLMDAKKEHEEICKKIESAEKRLDKLGEQRLANEQLQNYLIEQGNK
jgi:hypothetical protein